MFEIVQMFSAMILFAGSILFLFLAIMLAIDLIIDLVSNFFNKMKG